MIEKSGSTSLGRNAWLALGIGVGLFAVLVLLSFPVGKLTSKDEAFTCMAVGLSAFIGCLVWSVALALRALWSGEKQTLPLAVLVLESSVGLGLIGWAGWFDGPNFLRELYLTVLFPLYALIALTSAPVLLWVLRVMRKIREARGESEWPRERRRRFVLKWGGLYALIIVVLLEPWLIYTQAVLLNQKGKWITDNAPNFFRDAYEEMIHEMDPRWQDLNSRLMWSVSPERLEKRLFDPNEDLRRTAASYLELVDSSRLANAAEKIELGVLKPPPGSTTSYLNEMRGWILLFGNTAQRRAEIQKTKNQAANAYSMLDLLSILTYGVPDPALRVDIEELSVDSEDARSAHFLVLSELMPIEERRQYIRTEFTERGAQLRVLGMASRAWRQRERHFLVLWEILKLESEIERKRIVYLDFFGINRKLEPFKTQIPESEYFAVMAEMLEGYDAEVKSVIAAHVLYYFDKSGKGKPFSLEETRLWSHYKRMCSARATESRRAPNDEIVFESLRKKLLLLAGEKNAGKP